MTGGFLSADPLGHASDMSLYSYANGDPINFVDPTGMTVWDSALGVLKVIGGVGEAAIGYSIAVAGYGSTVAGNPVGPLIGVGGLAIGAHGVDTVQAGFLQMLSGEPMDTFTSQGLQAAGLSRDTANLVDAGLGIIGGGAGIVSAYSKASAISATNNVGSMNTWQILATADKGAAARTTASFEASGGHKVSDFARGLAVNTGKVESSGLHLGVATGLALGTQGWRGMGLTGFADLNIGAVSAASYLGLATSQSIQSSKNGFYK
ncbi:MAG: hypothetical protein NZM04_08090 [Methylacidiphilales bacterium]|nr:hypothetical protein [Candidatus Methylacidiphilales bacterium]